MEILGTEFDEFVCIVEYFTILLPLLDLYAFIYSTKLHNFFYI